MFRTFILVIGAISLSTAAALAQPAGGEPAPAARRPLGRPILGMPIGNTANDPRFDRLISTIADLNVSPGFELNNEQKQKLKAIRDEVKAAQAKWVKDNEENTMKLNEEIQAARETAMRDGGGMEKMRELMEKWRALRETFPKTDDAQKQVRALLTDQQLDALDKRLEEILAEQRKAAEEMRARMQRMAPGQQ